MPKSVEKSKPLKIYGPYPGSPNNPQHIMIMIKGKGYERRVYSDNDDLGPALKQIEKLLGKRLARRRAKKAAKTIPAPTP